MRVVVLVNLPIAPDARAVAIETFVARATEVAEETFDGEFPGAEVSVSLEAGK
jgi:hypothetical protein